MIRIAICLKVAVAVLGLLCPIGCATGQEDASGKPPGYEEAARAARKNGKSVRGRRYVKAVRNSLKGIPEDVIHSCQIREPDRRHIRLMYRLDADGDPVETMVYPASAFADCVIEGIRGFQFPPPPEPDYWITILGPVWRSLGPGR